MTAAFAELAAPPAPELAAVPGLQARPAVDGPLYFTPPSTEPIRHLIREGRLGAITTPAQGNALEDGFQWWCRDNGVFTGEYPGDREYLDGLKKMRRHADRCAFVVAPDVVGNHHATWIRSRPMLQQIRDLGFPVAFVAQNGMQWAADHIWDDIDCLFIGGDDAFKESADVGELISIANSLGLGTHMGRVNSERRHEIARLMGCNSVDGTYLTFGPDTNLPHLTSWARTADRIDLLDLDYTSLRPATNPRRARATAPRTPARAADQINLF